MPFGMNPSAVKKKIPILFYELMKMQKSVEAYFYTNQSVLYFGVHRFCSYLFLNT